tara:strand:- start:123 stop:494 length:372 start_codon:yes stop_codon:yes gene_type:complete
MKIRIDNIECRFSHGRYDIIKWYPNDYYGKEEKMIEEEGYERIEYGSGGFGLTKDHRTIDSSCFKNPESCYTIAYLEYDDDENCCDLTTVGPRLLKLKKKDRKAFFQVYKIADEAIRLERKRK